MHRTVFLDYAATTPVDERVAEAMSHCLTADGNFGNPASRSHLYGWRAEEAVEEARGQLAELLNADPREIIWTSGATEANNLAIKGVLDALVPDGSRGAYENHHVLTSAIEHKAVLDPCAALEKRGVSATYLQPDKRGRICAADVAAAIGPNTALVSVMLVNNEIGVINDVAAIGQLCREHGIVFHVDAAQAVGKEPIDVRQMNIDLLSVSAHKFYGPKGMGALYVRRTNDFSVAAQIHGGGHERKMRSGTLPTHQIVGLGEAARIARVEMPAEQARIRSLRDAFIKGISALEGVAINGDPDVSVPGIVNVRFADIEGENLLLALRELAISSGSACMSASLAPSYVLKSIGLDDMSAHSSLRFSFGRYTSMDDIDFAVNKVCSVVPMMREQRHVI